ncbi:MAG: bacterial transcriptional activator domain-containing protein [Chloroflexota bacterium]|nr:bacterial transcriptional activator domain-containing protein [Chloroflexota bacterium]
MNTVEDIIKDQYKQLGSKTRLILMHPHCRSQHVILNLVPDSSVYVRFIGTELTLDAATDQLDQVLVESGSNGKLKSADTLVLDECDRIPPDVMTTLIVDKLLPQVKKGRIIVLSRYMPVSLAQHPDVAGVVQVLPVIPEMMLSDYTQPAKTDKHLLEVWAMGSGRVMMNGKPIEQWDGVLPRALFFFIADRGMTTRGEIFEMFWPNLSVREATNVFHVTKRKVSEVLGADLTVFQSGFYHIADNIDLRYDVSVFNQFVQDSSVSEPQEAQQLLRQALRLYRGPFISTLDAPWVQRRRQQIGAAYGDALAALGRLVQQDGKHEEAFNWYARAIHYQPLREDAVEEVLKLGKKLKRNEEARALFQVYQTALREEDDAVPAAELQRLEQGLATIGARG